MVEKSELEGYLKVFLEDPSLDISKYLGPLDNENFLEFLELTYDHILNQRDPGNFDVLIELNDLRTQIYKVQIEELKQISTLDPLTSLPNRRGLYQQLDSLMSIASRNSSPLAISIFDIDHFKQFNDTHGHLVGDEALIQFGNYFNDRLRGSDLIARFGGEEFVLCLYDSTYEGAIDRIKKLGIGIQRESLKWEYSATGVKPISFSAGLSWLGTPNSTAENYTKKINDILAAADRNLYTAKGSGRNRLIASKYGQHSNKSSHSFA